MGFGGISPWSLLLILLIVVLLFGTKRLKNIGGDLGGAIKNFRKSVKDGENAAAQDEQQQISEEEASGGQVIEGKAEEKKES
jgi:sec-independent protein translocase protein TatA